MTRNAESFVERRIRAVRQTIRRVQFMRVTMCVGPVLCILTASSTLLFGCWSALRPNAIVGSVVADRISTPRRVLVPSLATDEVWRSSFLDTTIMEQAIPVDLRQASAPFHAALVTFAIPDRCSSNCARSPYAKVVRVAELCRWRSRFPIAAIYIALHSEIVSHPACGSCNSSTGSLIRRAA